MSRRLLLEDDYSENELKPVMDGLICWLDAMDANIGDITWIDRSINNQKFTVTNAYFEDNSLVMNSKSTIGWFTLPKEFTFCVCLKSDRTGQYQNIYDHSNTMLWIDTNYRIECNVHTKGQSLLKDSKNHIVTTRGLNNTKIYQESKLITTHLQKGVGTTDVSLFSRAGSQGLQGRIYSILIYNRELSQKEIQQNYEYEQSIERDE